MHRFVKVIGKAGSLVPHPERGATPRFIGMRMRTTPPEQPSGDRSHGDGPSLIDYFEPIEEVFKMRPEDSHAVESAICAGDLILLGRCAAANHEAAAKAMTAAKPAKRGE